MITKEKKTYYQSSKECPQQIRPQLKHHQAWQPDHLLPLHQQPQADLDVLINSDIHILIGVTDQTVTRECQLEGTPYVLSAMLPGVRVFLYLFQLHLLLDYSSVPHRHLL